MWLTSNLNLREFSRIFCNILPLTHHPHLKTHRTSIRRWISLGKERNLMQPPEPGAKTKMRVKLFLCRRISCSSRDKDAEMDEIELFVEGFYKREQSKTNISKLWRKTRQIIWQILRFVIRSSHGLGDGEHPPQTHTRLILPLKGFYREPLVFAKIYIYPCHDLHLVQI